MSKPGKMLREVLDHLFKKPATVAYPFQKISMSDTFRGQIRFVAQNCIGCKLCMKDCPAEAIIITQVGDKAERRFECTFKLDRCLFCAQCVETCPKQALETTIEFELAQLDRQKLVAHFDAAPKKETAPASAADQSAQPKP